VLYFEKSVSVALLYYNCYVFIDTTGHTCQSFTLKDTFLYIILVRLSYVVLMQNTALQTAAFVAKCSVYKSIT